MSVSTAAHPPRHRAAAAAKFWLAVLFIVAAGIGLAWLGAASMRGETTASGLQFRTILAGSGPAIKDMDGVLIEYEGRLIDGTIFDSSEGRGPQPVIPAQMIPGFREALLKMQEGGRYHLVVPAEMAYGSESPPGSPIPPNSDLEFDVQVTEVVPDAGLMAQQQLMEQDAQQEQQSR